MRPQNAEVKNTEEYCLNGFMVSLMFIDPYFNSLYERTGAHATGATYGSVEIFYQAFK